MEKLICQDGSLTDLFTLKGVCFYKLRTETNFQHIILKITYVVLFIPVGEKSMCTYGYGQKNSISEYQQENTNWFFFHDPKVDFQYGLYSLSV